MNDSPFTLSEFGLERRPAFSDRISTINSHHRSLTSNLQTQLYSSSSDIRNNYNGTIGLKPSAADAISFSTFNQNPYLNNVEYLQAEIDRLKTKLNRVISTAEETIEEAREQHDALYNQMLSHNSDVAQENELLRRENAELRSENDDEKKKFNRALRYIERLKGGNHYRSKSNQVHGVFSPTDSVIVSPSSFISSAKDHDRLEGDKYDRKQRTTPETTTRCDFIGDLAAVEQKCQQLESAISSHNVELSNSRLETAQALILINELVSSRAITMRSLHEGVEISLAHVKKWSSENEHLMDYKAKSKNILLDKQIADLESWLPSQVGFSVANLLTRVASTMSGVNDYYKDILDDLSERNTTLQDKLTSAQTKIDVLSEDLKAAKESVVVEDDRSEVVDELRRQLDECRAEFETKSTQLTQSQLQNKTLTEDSQRSAALQRENKELSNQLTLIQSRIGAGEEQSQSHIHLLKTELDRVSGEATESLQSLIKRVNELEIERNELKFSIDVTSRNYNSMKSKLVDAQTLYQNSEVLSNAQKESIKKFESELDSRRKSIMTLQASLADTQKEMLLLRHAYEEKEQLCDNLSMQSKEILEKQRIADEQSVKSRSELNKRYESVIDIITKELDNLKERYQELSIQYNDRTMHEEAITPPSPPLVDLTNQIQSLSMQIESQREEHHHIVLGLEKQLEASVAAIAVHLQEKAHLINQLREGSQSNDDLKSQLLVNIKQNEELMSAMNDSKEALDCMREMQTIIATNEFLTLTSSSLEVEEASTSMASCRLSEKLTCLLQGGRDTIKHLRDQLEITNNVLNEKSNELLRLEEESKHILSLLLDLELVDAGTELPVTNHVEACVINYQILTSDLAKERHLNEDKESIIQSMTQESSRMKLALLEMDNCRNKLAVVQTQLIEQTKANEIILADFCQAQQHLAMRIEEIRQIEAMLQLHPQVQPTFDLSQLAELEEFEVPLLSIASSHDVTDDPTDDNNRKLGDIGAASSLTATSCRRIATLLSDLEDQSREILLLRELVSKLNTVELQLIDAQSAEQTLQIELTTLKIQLNEKDECMAKMRESKESETHLFTVDINNLQSQLEIAEKEIKALRFGQNVILQGNASLQRSHDELLLHWKALKLQHEELQLKQNNLVESSEILRNKNAESLLELETTRAKNEALEIDCNKALESKRVLEIIEQKLRLEVEILTKQVATLQGELEQQSDIHKITLTLKQTTISSLESELTTSKTRCDALKSLHVECMEECHRLEVEASQLKERHCSDKQTWETEETNRESRTKLMQSDYNLLHEQFIDLESRYASMALALETQISLLTGQVDDLDEECRQLKSNHAEKSVELSRQVGETSALREVQFQMETSLRQINVEKESLENRCVYLDASIEKLTAENVSLSHQLKTMSAAHESLVQELIASKEEITRRIKAEESSASEFL